MMGRGELLLLDGKPERAGKLFTSARDLAAEFGLKLEVLHARVMQRILSREKGRSVSFSDLRHSYARLGADFLPEQPTLPLNLP